MDWLGAIWSPLWFAWDICNNALILWKTRKWVRGSVTDTKDLVVAEIKKPELARELKAAMDIPDKADLAALEKKVDDALGQLKYLEELRDLLKEPPNIEFPIDELVSALDTKIGDRLSDRINGKSGADAKGADAAYREVQREYASSPDFDEDNAEMIGALVQKGCPQFLARRLVAKGPDAVYGWMRDMVGPKEAKELLMEYKRERMAGRSLVPASGGGGW